MLHMGALGVLFVWIIESSGGAQQFVCGISEASLCRCVEHEQLHYSSMQGPFTTFSVARSVQDPECENM